MMVENNGRTSRLKTSNYGNALPNRVWLYQPAVSERNHSCQWCMRSGRQLHTCNGKLRTEVNQ